MGVQRKTRAGLSVFPAIKLSDGPPEVWVAVAADRRLASIQTAMGRGQTALEAEVEALALLGATPNTVRAALEILGPDDVDID